MEWIGQIYTGTHSWIFLIQSDYASECKSVKSVSPVVYFRLVIMVQIIERGFVGMFLIFLYLTWNILVNLRNNYILVFK